MALKIKFRKDKIRSYTLAVSILLHLLILLLIQIDRDFIFPRQIKKPEKAENRLVFELVETPKDSQQEKPDKDSKYVSDKNTRNADLTESDLPDENPFSEGDVHFPELANIDEQQKTSKDARQENPAEILSEIQEKQKSFLETLQASRNIQKIADPSYENLISQVKNRGGMSLNTYQWEFAPYLLEMKHKIQDHNNPPFAFTHLGAIKGDILLRFKVLQDGTVKDLEILNSTAHYSLESTSTRAIQFAAPFKPLPVNFPKDYLEITALFSYIITGK